MSATARRKIIKERSDKVIPMICAGREVVKLRAFTNEHGDQLEITGDVNVTVRIERQRGSMRYFMACEGDTSIGKPRYD